MTQMTIDRVKRVALETIESEIPDVDYGCDYEKDVALAFMYRVEGSNPPGKTVCKHVHPFFQFHHHKTVFPYKRPKNQTVLSFCQFSGIYSSTKPAYRQLPFAARYAKLLSALPCILPPQNLKEI